MTETVKLIAQTFTVNANGDEIATETERVVFATRKSIGLKRKLEASEAGLKLEYKFILTDELEYHNEEILEYNGVRYNIVNAFVDDNYNVELMTTRY